MKINGLRNKEELYMFNNVELLINYAKIKCEENDIQLDITCSEGPHGTKICFSLTKNSKRILVCHWLRDIILSEGADLKEFFKDIDTNIKNIENLAGRDYKC